MAKYTIRFQVRNLSGFEFPIDMLRYDSCYPDSEEDAGEITKNMDIGSAKVNTLVTLETVKNSPDWYPTKSRWESFGWEVVGIKESFRNHKNQ